MFLHFAYIFAEYEVELPFIDYFLGLKFCKRMHLNISCYLIGSIWTCLTAMYRVLYIKGPNWIKCKIGEKSFLYTILILGLCLILSLASLLVFADEESLTLKLCNHQARTYLEILNSYKVKQNSDNNISYFLIF